MVKNGKKLGIIILFSFLTLGFLNLGHIFAQEATLESFKDVPWEDGGDFPIVGDENAKKGGMIRYPITEYPATFRVHGPNSNTSFISMISTLVYQRLVNLHPSTLEPIPGLAEAWKIMPDKKTFIFRLDPEAKWADNRPVTVEDVIFSWDLVTDPAIKDPYITDLYKRFERPEKIGDREVKFVANTLHWRNFMFCGMNLAILPKHIYEGKNFVDDFQWELPAGSGPYELSSYKKGTDISFTRRPNFWGKDKPAWKGQYNFNLIRFTVVRDRDLMWEKFKKGELDWFVVGVARQWVRETNFDKVQNGWIQKYRVWNKSPQGVNGLAFNMRRAPYNDIRIRKALTHLYDRDTLMNKLFYNQYELMESYFAGSIYENQENEKMTYDPEKAAKLLAEAGYSKRNSDGILVNDNNEPLVIKMIYPDSSSERHLTVYKEDLRKAGVDLQLQLTNFQTLVKLVDERNFDMVELGWGAMLFPNPEPNYHSKFADVPQTNNIYGIKDPEIDQILDAYNGMFTQEERVVALQKLDGLVHKLHPYVLNWYGPYTRIMYWNRYGHPSYIFSALGDNDEILNLWWYDEKKDAELKSAMKSKKKLPVGPVEMKHWLEETVKVN